MNTWLRKGLLYLLLLVIALFLTFPMIWMACTSLKGQMESLVSLPPRWIPAHPTLGNYRAVFEQVDFFRAFLNSARLTAMGVLFNVLTAALAAYPLARFQFTGKKTIFALILAPMMIPLQGTMIANYVTLKNLGLLNTLLGVAITTAVPIIGIFLLKAAYEAVPVEMEEAARVDGCGELGIWWCIMLPMVQPSLAAVAILGFVQYWNDFMWPLIVLRDLGKAPIPVALAKLEAAFQTNFRYVSAGAVLSMLPILCFFAFTQRFFIEGTRGAIKG